MGLTSTQKKDNNIVEIEVSVGADELKAAADRVFRRKVKTLSVPGFRKGKAPRQIIEKMYGEGVFLEDAVNELYPKAYSNAIDEAGIEPVDRADVEVLTLDKETGFTFRATVTVKPEVELGAYKGLKVEKVIHKVTDADIDREIERMRDRNARIISVDNRPAQDGDSVVIDFEGFIDGVAFDGGKAENHNITLGTHSFIDTFEEQICGHNTGDEFDVNVSFPEQYHAENLAGKPALFKVKLVEIKGKELPELDDEFVKDVSEFDTLDELKADIRKKQEETNKQHTEDSFENMLIDGVIAEMKADIPDCMINNRVEDMVQDFEHRISRQGMKIDMYLQYTGMTMEAFQSSFKEEATRQVKIKLALEKIAELEKIEATEEDIEKEYGKIAEVYSLEPDKVRGMVPEKEIVDGIKTTKALDFVRDSAEATEVIHDHSADEHEHAEGETTAKKTAAKKPAAKKTAKKEKEAE